MTETEKDNVASAETDLCDVKFFIKQGETENALLALQDAMAKLRKLIKES